MKTKNENLRSSNNKPLEKLDMKIEKACEIWAHNSAETELLTSDVKKAVLQVINQTRQDIAQECYLQCLAVECGEGECSQAIASKFPELISRLNEENRLDLK